MAPLHWIAVASVLFGGAVAQSEGDSAGLQNVWAAVVFINHGETTPLIGPLDTVLTSEGAQQMLRQGTAFRNRYLSVNNKDPGPDAAPMPNIGQGAINNRQITALSQTEEYVVAGATAFFQGLYPGNDGAYNNDAGGMDVFRNLPAGDNLTDYPLGGYQYARIQTVPRSDIEYASLQGTSGCQTWRAETAELTTTEELKQSYRGSFQFYQDLFESGPLEGLIDPVEAQFWMAYEVYDLVKYMYTHNSTVFRQLENANDTLALLEANALELETAFTNPPSNKSNEETNVVYTIGGRTLADRVQWQLGQNVDSAMDASKLTVMFGTHMPMMSFFHIAGLKSGENSSSESFSKLPRPGSAMIFELIGNNEEETAEMPSADSLRVRFLYRDGADADAEFKAASLFGSSGAEQGIPWTDFSRSMLNIGVDPSTWCGICQPMSVPWCSASNDSRDSRRNEDDGSSSSGGMSPAVAGVIGAIVTLAGTAFLGLALFLIWGFRLRRSEKEGDNAAAGGFKGAERMPDDEDVATSKGGVRHERAGSWELREAPGTPPAFNGAGIVTSDFHRRGDSMSGEDDGISVTGARVVNTHESV